MPQPSRPEQITQAALRRALFRAIVLPLLLMGALTGLLLWQLHHLLAVNQSLDRSNRVLADARRTLRIFVDMETGLRGYLITGADDFLRPFLDGRNDIPASLAALKVDVSNDPRESAVLTHVLRSHQDWQRFASLAIGRKATGGDYVHLVLTRRGKNDMDSIRAGMAKIMSLEEHERDTSARSAQDAARRTVSGAVIAAVLLGALLSMLIRRDLMGVGHAYGQALLERENAEADLRLLNESLEQRVSERTAALETANVDLYNEIVERQRAQARLEEQARLLDLAHDTIMVRQRDGTIVFWNHGAEEMYGWSREEAVGKKSHDLLRTRFPQPFAEMEAAVFTLGRWEGELVHTRRDGRLITVASRWAPSLDAHGQPDGILEINNDITRRKTAEEQLKDYAARLEQSNRELQDFAVVASHDLQEPLRKIQAFGGLLEEEYASQITGDGREYLEEMVNAASRMQHLIQALLTLSRVSTRGQPFAPTDLGRVVRDVLDDLQARMDETEGIVDVGPLPTIEADPTQMRQLFQNLIGNALKFHRPGEPPVVRVRAEITRPATPAGQGSTPDEVGSTPNGQGSAPDTNEGPNETACRIMVEDNGVGFDEKYLDRIFAPFQRLHGRGQFEGTGMGLTICRRIVERHNGTITARSAPGQGTTFIITLPVRQAAAAQDANTTQGNEKP